MALTRFSPVPTGKDGESNFVIFAFETKHFTLCEKERKWENTEFVFLMDQSFQV